MGKGPHQACVTDSPNTPDVPPPRKLRIENSFRVSHFDFRVSLHPPKPANYVGAGRLIIASNPTHQLPTAPSPLETPGAMLLAQSRCQEHAEKCRINSPHAHHTILSALRQVLGPKGQNFL